MSTSGELLFLVCSFVAVLSAVGTVMLRSPLRAAISLLAHILSLAGLYLTLHAHLLAAIQLLVYAGAVVVLFIFVIMLIGPSAEDTQAAPRGMLTKAFGAGLIAMVLGGIAFQVGEVQSTWTDLPACEEGVSECGQYGGVDAMSAAIFVESAIPFEMVSLLLLVAIIAAIAVARGHTPDEKRALEAKQKREIPVRPTVLDPPAGASASGEESASPAE